MTKKFWKIFLAIYFFQLIFSKTNMEQTKQKAYTLLYLAFLRTAA